MGVQTPKLPILAAARLSAQSDRPQSDRITDRPGPQDVGAGAERLFDDLAGAVERLDATS